MIQSVTVEPNDEQLIDFFDGKLEANMKIVFFSSPRILSFQHFCLYVFLIVINFFLRIFQKSPFISELIELKILCHHFFLAVNVYFLLNSFSFSLKFYALNLYYQFN
jgi:hypothetical protein